MGKKMQAIAFVAAVFLVFEGLSPSWSCPWPSIWTCWGPLRQPEHSCIPRGAARSILSRKKKRGGCWHPQKWHSGLQVRVGNSISSVACGDLTHTRSDERVLSAMPHVVKSRLDLIQKWINKYNVNKGKFTYHRVRLCPRCWSANTHSDINESEQHVYNS